MKIINKYVMGVIAGIAILAIGITTGVMLGRQANTAGQSGVTGQNTYQAGWDAAKKRLADTGYSPLMMAEVKSISGAVQDVQTGGLTIKIRALEPLADPALDIRTVKFDANTKFYRQKQKDPIAYQKEVVKFNQTIQQTATRMGKPLSAEAPPQPYERVEIKGTDLKAGDQVTVTAGSDIKEAKEFVATEVIAQEVMVPAAAPAPAAR